MVSFIYTEVVMFNVVVLSVILLSVVAPIALYQTRVEVYDSDVGLGN